MELRPIGTLNRMSIYVKTTFESLQFFPMSFLTCMQIAERGILMKKIISIL
jgi:hypothetical protein